MAEATDKLRADMLSVILRCEELYPGLMDEARERLGMEAKPADRVPLSACEQTAVVMALHHMTLTNNVDGVASAFEKLRGTDKRVWVEVLA